MYYKAIQILKKINNLGYEAYIVGGYPRDKYLNKESIDIDICTNMPLDIINKHFNVIKEYKQFGVVLIEDDYTFEITLFRKDVYIDNRYPVVDFVSNLKDDLYRRDFIINTLCIDKDENYIDLYGAIDDLDRKIIRMIDNPSQRLKEDPIRILRAIRFSLILDFNIEPKLETAIIENGYLISKLSKSIIDKEINKIIKDKDIEILKKQLKKYNLEVDICKKN